MRHAPTIEVVSSSDPAATVSKRAVAISRDLWRPQRLHAAGTDISRRHVTSLRGFVRRTRGSMTRCALRCHPRSHCSHGVRRGNVPGFSRSLRQIEHPCLAPQGHPEQRMVLFLNDPESVLRVNVPRTLEDALSPERHVCISHRTGEGQTALH